MVDRYVAEPAGTAWRVLDTETQQTFDEGLPADAVSVMVGFYNGGICPGCPAEPPKVRRSRCPICQEWLVYQPQHPGHKYPRYEKGRIKWRKGMGFSAAYYAFLGHSNANAETHQGQAYLDAFYNEA